MLAENEAAVGFDESRGSERVDTSTVEPGGVVTTEHTDRKALRTGSSLLVGDVPVVDPLARRRREDREGGRGAVAR